MRIMDSTMRKVVIDVIGPLTLVIGKECVKFNALNISDSIISLVELV